MKWYTSFVQPAPAEAQTNLEKRLEARRTTVKAIVVMRPSQLRWFAYGSVITCRIRRIDAASIKDLQEILDNSRAPCKEVMKGRTQEVKEKYEAMPVVYRNHSGRARVQTPKTSILTIL